MDRIRPEDAACGVPEAPLTFEEVPGIDVVDGELLPRTPCVPGIDG
ncbi:MAG: hypothetical protein QM604_00850 [Microbacterium sp.]